eukprot:s8939_g2.t2
MYGACKSSGRASSSNWVAGTAQSTSDQDIAAWARCNRPSIRTWPSCDCLPASTIDPSRHNLQLLAQNHSDKLDQAARCLPP